MCNDFDEVATKALSTPTNTAELVQLQEDVKKVCFDLYRLNLWFKKIKKSTAFQRCFTVFVFKTLQLYKENI